ncbi:unannotated protein [freshwater metagenome]|uniref:Unannotated protein n=1 Tax=freshwater metagenome TaxID=449393 RepID=A0A6J7URK7_9ZZZZ
MSIAAYLVLEKDEGSWLKICRKVLSGDFCGCGKEDDATAHLSLLRNLCRNLGLVFTQQKLGGAHVDRYGLRP